MEELKKTLLHLGSHMSQTDRRDICYKLQIADVTFNRYCKNDNYSSNNIDLAMNLVKEMKSILKKRKLALNG